MIFSQYPILSSLIMRTKILLLDLQHLSSEQLNLGCIVEMQSHLQVYQITKIPQLPVI